MPITTTIGTPELFAASQLQVHTAMTGLRAIAWRYWDDLNSVSQYFVLQKSTKLIKSPGVRLSRLSSLLRGF
jgi:hypothetical protein